MHLHVLQHVPFEGLGCITGWLAAHSDAKVTYTRFFDDARLPILSDLDLIIVLGGPMSVNEEERYPWLGAEKRFLSAAIENGTPLLGICLGAQLIASALGARVYPGPSKEIGWYPVFAEPVQPEMFAFPAEVPVFHWHGETFDLPAGADLLAHSAVCRHQAFQVGRRTMGLQFHLEATPASAESIITNCADELVPEPYIQSMQELRSVPDLHYTTINALMVRILDYLVESRLSSPEEIVEVLMR